MTPAAPPLRALAYTLLCSTLLCSGCAVSENPEITIGTLAVSLAPVEAGVLLPGGYFEVNGDGFLEDATLTLQLTLNGATHTLEHRRRPDGALEARWPIPLGLASPQARAQGTLSVEVTLNEARGAASAPWTADLARELAPQLDALSPSAAPQTPRPVSAQRLLRDGEGASLLLLRGALTPDPNTGSPPRVIEVTVPLSRISTDRTSGDWLPAPSEWGLSPGLFEGEARLINQGHAATIEGALTPARFSYSPPSITALSKTAISRGELLTLKGEGFVGGEAGGFTTVTFRGTFEPYNTLEAPTSWASLSLPVEWASGDTLTLFLSPQLDERCGGEELGARSGVLLGELWVTTSLGQEVVDGPPLPLELEIKPARQVVYVELLPSFVDSLRLFGLRNVSGQVVEAVLRVVERDYEGVNLELRREPPLDFALYSTVQLGGPDPNAQDLFGLDNTTGLDTCNQRLNDNLGGRNADSGNTYGGVFVESFLNLSARRGSSPLADPLFDEIFNPLISAPARVGEEGPRAALISRAINALSNLVGNTMSHELGHSLGLPMYPGCGQYHTAPGELQMMDCGQDRPFLERAGLDPRGFATWTPEDLQYLQKILPIY
jgi:hypothetical protein